MVAEDATEDEPEKVVAIDIAENEEKKRKQHEESVMNFLHKNSGEF